LHGVCENRQALRVRFVDSPTGALRVWWPPEHVIRGTPLPDTGVATEEQMRRGWSTEALSIDHHYAGAADIAKGVEGGDSNSAVILDRYYRRVVAEWHELCASVVFGEYLSMLALWYNAEIAVEMDGVGQEAITKMLQLVGGEYVWAYHKQTPGVQVAETEYGRWGWKAMDRRAAVTALEQVVLEGGWLDPSVEAWAEIMGIVRNASGFPLISGRDRTAARCILAHLDRMMPPAVGRSAERLMPPDYRMPVDDEPKMDWRTAGLPQGHSGDWRTAGLRKG